MTIALQDIPSESAHTSAPSAPSTSNGGTGAPSSGSPFDSSLFMLLMFVPLIAMMLWTSRSQTKRQQKLIAELKKGDTVLTQSGIRGKLVEIGDRFAKIEIAPGTKIEVLKSAVLGKDTAEAAAQVEKK